MQRQNLAGSIDFVALEPDGSLSLYGSAPGACWTNSMVSGRACWNTSQIPPCGTTASTWMCRNAFLKSITMQQSVACTSWAATLTIGLNHSWTRCLSWKQRQTFFGALDAMGGSSAAEANWPVFFHVKRYKPLKKSIYKKIEKQVFLENQSVQK